MRIVIGSLLAVGLGATAGGAMAGSGETRPDKDLARESYQIVTDPASLPGEVQASWAAALRQKQLDVAAAGGRYNSTDFGGGTRHRLIMAAVGPRYAVVYFESGGFAVSRRAFVFSRAADAAALIWSGHPKDRYTEPKGFLSAIRNGKLWRERKRAG